MKVKDLVDVLGDNKWIFLINEDAENKNGLFEKYDTGDLPQTYLNFSILDIFVYKNKIAIQISKIYKSNFECLRERINKIDF